MALRRTAFIALQINDCSHEPDIEAPVNQRTRSIRDLSASLLKAGAAVREHDAAEDSHAHDPVQVRSGNRGVIE